MLISIFFNLHILANVKSFLMTNIVPKKYTLLVNCQIEDLDDGTVEVRVFASTRAGEGDPGETRVSVSSTGVGVSLRE